MPRHILFPVIHLISHSGSAKKISEKSVGYKEKEKGQTLISEDLSSVAPELGLEPRTL